MRVPFGREVGREAYLRQPHPHSTVVSQVYLFTSLQKTNVSNWIRVNTDCFKREPKLISSEYFIADDTRPAIDHQPNVTKRRLTLQIAYSALFLASDEATFVNGTSISINDDGSDGRAL